MARLLMLLTSFLILSGCRMCDTEKVDMTPNIGGQLRQSSHPIRRVAILPMESNFEDQAGAKLLQSSIVESLRQRGAFEIIEIPPERLGPCSTSIIEDGVYDERQLVWLMKQYNVDAVMYSRLNHVKQIAPQSMSAICHIVDARESYIIATAEGSWDLSFSGDLERFREYVRLNDLNFFDMDLAVKSPQAMNAFVGEEIALTLY